MDAKNYKNVYPKVFDFCKILKCATKYYEIPKFVLFCTKWRYSQIKPQLKVEIEDGREAPQKPILKIELVTFLIRLLIYLNLLQMVV